MKKYVITIISLISATGFGQVDTSQTPATPAVPPAAAKPFETAGPVETSRFIPAELMSGKLHRVGVQAYNDTMGNMYNLYAEQSEFDILTGIMLRVRIQEVYAIAKLREMQKGKEFTQAMANAGKQKVEGVVGLVTNPIGTIKNVPRGASRFFGRIGESVKGGDSEEEGSALQNLTGVQKAKVALAAKLGVNPYSTNQELQKELTTNARAMAGGGLIVSAATAAVGGPAGAVITGLNVNDTLQQTLVNSTPSDLRILNRKKLFALGVTREDADALLMHPWYSPWAETITVDALSSIGVDPTAFLGRAVTAQTEDDALYFQRLAQAMANYQKVKAPLKSIQVQNGVVCAMDQDGNLVVPVSCDYAVWAERPAGRIDEFSALRTSRPEIKGLVLWVDGKVSDRGLEELKTRNIEVVTGVLDKPSKQKDQ
jgi:hypothetical protein